MALKTLFDVSFALDQFLLDVCSVVPMHIADDPRRKPVHLEWTQLDETRNGTHEPDRKAVGRDLWLLDRLPADFLLGRVHLLVLVVEV